MSRKKLRLIAGAAVFATVITGGATAWALSSPSHSRHLNALQANGSTSTTLAADQPEEVVSSTTTTLVDGPSAAVITATQQKLNDLGYWAGPIDGKGGQATQQALLAFQKINGLPKTGLFDTATLSALTTATRPTPASKTGDLIEIDKSRQVIFFVRGGQTLWIFNTSTGTESSYVTNGVRGFAHTPDGTFKVLRTVDAVDPGPLGPLYRPRYFTNTGIAIHGAAAIPATPASHGCARVSNAAMDFIWANNLMPMQSLVWVYDNPATQVFAPPASTTTTLPTTTTAPRVTTTTTTAPVVTTTTTSIPQTTTSSTTTSSTTSSTTSTTV